MAGSKRERDLHRQKLACQQKEAAEAAESRRGRLRIAGIVVAVVAHFWPSFDAATIGSKFSVVIDGETVRGIPPLPPLPVLPWHLGGADGAAFAIDYTLIRALLPSAFAIAMLDRKSVV